ncbi:MAG TPA: alpha/beta hydrolase [Anaerolineae bacterium]|nr:alpha/beta hydrolase [Anaerolineae bacterium]
MAFVTVDDLRIHYQAVGQGQDVLLIHGWLSSWRMWARSMSRLAAAGYRATAIDLVGFGESDKPADGWYSLDNYTASLVAVCEQLHLDRPAIVGHSMGGTIALELALVIEARAVLVAAPVVSGKLTFSVHPLLTSPTARRFMNWLRQQKFFSALGAMRPLAAPGLTRDPVSKRNHQDLQRTNLNATFGSLRTVAGTNLEDHLSDITAPTLILVGGRDFTVTPAQGKLAALRIPNARLVEWPAAGHSMVDDQADEFDRLLIDHLKQADKPSTNNSSTLVARNLIDDRPLLEIRSEIAQPATLK